MVIKNGYEARLAKMAGDENVTIPKPTNAYMKYMDGIETGGSGGGGGSDGDILIVNYVFGDDVQYLDVTYAEIQSAFLAGKAVVIVTDNSFDDPRYGYTAFRYERVCSIDSHVITGTDPDAGITYYQVYTSGIGTFQAHALDERPVYASD